MKIERTNPQLRELVDTVVDRVLELARHPATEGDGDHQLRALLESFTALTEAELDELEAEQLVDQEEEEEEGYEWDGTHESAMEQPEPTGPSACEGCGHHVDDHEATPYMPCALEGCGCEGFEPKEAREPRPGTPEYYRGVV